MAEILSAPPWDTAICSRTVLQWATNAGINRSRSEGRRLSPRTKPISPKQREQWKRLRATQVGKGHPNWKGDEVEYAGQHRRAVKDFPSPLGICEACGEKKARVRMRVDHTMFPYHPDLVMVGCDGCNNRHTSGHIAITFLNPHDQQWYCVYTDRRIGISNLTTGNLDVIPTNLLPYRPQG